MLKQRIESDLKVAMKSRDELVTSTLRMLVAAIRNKEISVLKKDSGLTDEEITQVIRTEVKKRKEAVEGFKKGGRSEMAEKEKAEEVILEVYLPAEIGDEELLRIVSDKVEELGIEHREQNFGIVMRAVVAMVKGRATGERVAEAVKKTLASS